MRYYNGCPDSKFQAYLDEQNRLHAELGRMGIRATYFPAEERWMGFKDYRPVTEFHATLAEVVHACKGHVVYGIAEITATRREGDAP